jgi:AraC-like DNA-binding protein
MFGHTIHAAPAALAGLFDAIWDIDMPDGDAARSLHINVLPIVAPVICLHYRAPIRSEASDHSKACRVMLTGARTRAGMLYPTGPVGAVAARLRPSAVARLVRGEMAHFANAHVDLAGFVAPAKIETLTDEVAAAKRPADRVAALARFLLTHFGDDHADRLVDHAAARLRRELALPVHRLADALEISERQLERRFRTGIGLSPKQFARVARCERILAARGRGHGWADIAAACGFADQAHMVRDFKSMVGAAPDAFARMVFAPERRRVNGSLAMSGFFNTFVM